MPEKRRSLVDGLKDTPDPRTVSEGERDFVYDSNSATQEKATNPSAKMHKPKAEPKPRDDKPKKTSSLREAMEAWPQTSGRVPIGVKLHPVVAESLERLILFRKLSKTKPNTKQDIVDQAIIEWLEKQADINKAL